MTKNLKKILKKTPLVIKKGKEVSQLESAKKASLDNHNNSKVIFSHTHSNRGK